MTERMNSQTAPDQAPFGVDPFLWDRLSAAEGDALRLAAELQAAQAQLLETQKANTKLIAQIVDLEYECKRLAGVLRYVLGMGLPGHITTYLRAAMGDKIVQAPPRAQDPPPHCWNCGLPLDSAGLRDEVVIARGGHRVSVHRVCADHLTGQGWKVVAQAKEVTL